MTETVLEVIAVAALAVGVLVLVLYFSGGWK